MRALPVLLLLSAALWVPAMAAPAAPSAEKSKASGKAAALPSLDSTRVGPTLKELEPRVRYSFSGQRFVLLKEGKGDLPKPGDLVNVKYLGWTTDGVEFDGSYKRGVPFSFTLGKGEVIKGWEDALADMRPGERRYLILPPELAYGAGGSGPIPPNATLIFDVERLDF